MAIKSYRDLIVWQKSMDLVIDTYKLTRKFPHEEIYALTNQVRRAAVSVPSNIAEGQARQSIAEFRKSLSFSHGSLAEIETQVEIALRLNYISQEEADSIFNATTEVGLMLRSLLKKLNEKLGR